MYRQLIEYILDWELTSLSKSGGQCFKMIVNFQDFFVGFFVASIQFKTFSPNNFYILVDRNKTCF